MRRTSPVIPVLLLSATLALTGCQSSEERAQDHFERGVELLAEGDARRAFVEFRNVFKLDPMHKDARMAYAHAQMERGNMSEAYGQFLRVVEQYPEEIEARIILAEMAIQGRSWDEARRHGSFVIERQPDDPRVQVIRIALDYFDAVQAEEIAALANLADEARDVLASTPDNKIARRIVIDQLLMNGRYDEALPVIDAGIDIYPEDPELHELKLTAQLRSQKTDEAGATLRTIVETFPDNERARRLLIAWYIDQGDMEGAEAFLRELAARPDAEEGTKLAIVQFLRNAEGEEAARAELERLAASEESPTIYVALLASMDFENGERDKAISTLEQLVDGIDPATEQGNNAKILLAKMLLATGNPVGARARVEEILADDTSHVGALKLRAGWRIDEDQPGEAIIDLRTALSQAPRDAEIMTLMARAHERAGDRALAGERYALAVEFSNKAPTESLRYATFLVGEDRAEAAEAVVTEALNETPSNVPLLEMLGSINVRAKDWNETQRTIWKLRALDTEEATAVANRLEAEMLLQQDRVEDTVAFLEQLSRDSGDLQTLSALVQTQVRNGNIDEATGIIEERLAETPEDPALRFLRAGLHVLSDERDIAEDVYRGILADFPANDAVIRSLYSLLLAEGRQEDARALIEDQIALNPNALNVRLIKAELLERDRDFDGAIDVYSQLYEENSNNIVIANNLASLLATHRDDPESLERAYAVARRLRGIEVPALQDTYGWIEFRRGNFQDALSHLEPAAAGLPNDPLVQYHLGRAYLELEDVANARELLERAVRISGDAPLPQIQHAKELLETIPADQTSEETAD